MVRSQAGLLSSEPTTVETKYSPSEMSCGFSSVLVRMFGSTYETDGREPDFASAWNWSIVLIRPGFFFTMSEMT